MFVRRYLGERVCVCAERMRMIRVEKGTPRLNYIYTQVLKKKGRKVSLATHIILREMLHFII